MTPNRSFRRVTRGLRLLLPTLGTGLVRSLQLLVLIAISHGATGANREALIIGFGLIAAFAMMTDSGAANYLLATESDRLGRRLFGHAVLVHIAFAAVGGIGALVFLAASIRAELAPQAVAVLIALALTQALDNVSRIVRTPLMTLRRDAEFATPDIVLFALKTPVLVVAIVQASVDLLLLLPLPSLVITVVSYVRVRRMLPERDRTPGVVLPILEYGVTGALSAAYTQAPLLVATTVLPPAQVAALTIVYRVVQALDIVPSTLASQLIPRVRDREERMWQFWGLFAFAALLIALVTVALAPVVGVVFNEDFRGSDLVVYIAIALSFSPKAGNYAFAAYLMGTGRIRVRFRLTSIGCALSVALSVVSALVGGVVMLAFVPLVVEFVFAFIGFLLVKRGPVLPRSHNKESPHAL